MSLFNLLIEMIFFKQGKNSFILKIFSKLKLSQITVVAPESLSLNNNASSPNKLKRGIEIFPLLKHAIWLKIVSGHCPKIMPTLSSSFKLTLSKTFAN